MSRNMSGPGAGSLGSIGMGGGRARRPLIRVAVSIGQRLVGATVVTLLLVFCCERGPAAAQSPPILDQVQCHAPQGPTSLDNGSSRCAATAEENSQAQSTASTVSSANAMARANSTAKSTAMNHSSAEANAFMEGQATAVAQDGSSSSATADVFSIAKSVSTQESSAQVHAGLGSHIQVLAVNHSSAEAFYGIDLCEGCQLSAVARDHSEAHAIGTDLGIANSEAATHSAADALADRGGNALATAHDESRAGAQADLTGDATAQALKNSLASAFGTDGTAEAFASQESTASASTFFGEAIARARQQSTATATTELAGGGSAKAFASQESTASADATGGGFASAWATNGAQAIADSITPPQCIAPPGYAKVESSAGNCEAGVGTFSGDLDADGDIDQADVQRLLAERNTAATGMDDPRDLNGDGKVSVLDARQLVLWCTRPQCAVQ